MMLPLVRILLLIVGALCILLERTNGCQFYPRGEYLRFVRIPENLNVGDEVFQVEVYPRDNISIKSIEKNEDVAYFLAHEVDSKLVSIRLTRTLEDLVDGDEPRSVLKFRLVCDHHDGNDMISSYLSVTVYVEDVNDHAPVFKDTPYHITVDELTPVGLTIFRGILAVDGDKPNTPNSDVQYNLVIPPGKDYPFALESSHRPSLVIARALDYDSGDKEFLLTLTASDRGLPPKSTNTTIKVSVLDNDDLGPKFTQEIYKTKITESYPITGRRIHQALHISPAIFASDQDISLSAPLRYEIISGNPNGVFSIDTHNATLFIEKELDADAERRRLPDATFVLMIQASQIDNPLRVAVARIEVQLLDLNDNVPQFEVDLYNISIVENLPVGFSVLQVVATDIDDGENAEFLYELDDQNNAFSLEKTTGWLTVRNHTVLDREQHSSLSMKIFAREKKPNIATPTETSSTIVEITLLDANDNNPTFVPSNLYEFTVYANDVQIGDIVGTVQATDPDLGRNGMVLYAIQGNVTSGNALPFSVDSKSGRISIREVPLSRSRHTLFIEASDQPVNPSERRYSLGVVTIDVSESNSKESRDDLPDFIGAPYEFWVGNNVEVGTSVGQVRVNSVARKFPLLYDLLHSYHEGVPFAVEERSGTITVIESLQKFSRQFYEFEAVITSEKDLSLVTNVTIHLVDSGYEAGVLFKASNSSTIKFHVRENLSGALIGRLNVPHNSNNTASTPAFGSKSLRFMIVNQADVTDDIGVSQDGTLYTKHALDRETREIYHLTVVAEYVRGRQNAAGIYQITIFVDDENDNPPIFTKSLYEGYIFENSLAHTEVNISYPINATDLDKGTNSVFTFTMFGDGQELFYINQTTGQVFYKGGGSLNLDREEKNLYTFNLVARDKGSLSSEVKLVIHITDVNDNSPKFKKIIMYNKVQIVDFDKSKTNITIVEEDDLNQTRHLNYIAPSYDTKQISYKFKTPIRLSVLEDVPIGSTVLKLIANDEDISENAVITYEVISEDVNPQTNAKDSSKYFMVHASNGEVIVAKNLPPDTEFKLGFKCLDKDGLKDSIFLNIIVKDVNDHAPVFKKSSYSFDTFEAVYSRNVLGKIEAIDKDFGQNANISYGIMGLNDYELPFIISEFSGVLSVNGALDREIRDKYVFKVIAQDNAYTGKKLSSTVDVEVNILDINDNAPTFYGYDQMIKTNRPDATQIANHNFESVLSTPVYFASVYENSPIGTIVAKVFANDSDFVGNGNGLLLYDIPQKINQINLFNIDSKDGTVTTIGHLDYETQNVHNVTIVASDLGSPSLSTTALLVVTVIDVPENDTVVKNSYIMHRYYEVEVEENVHVPLRLLSINISEAYNDQKFKFGIVTKQGSEIAGMFRINPRNGTLYLIRSPDREKTDKYELVIRVEKVKVGRGMSVMIFPVEPDRLSDINSNEVKVIVRIKDVNDNTPNFFTNGKPIIAAIPTTASYGYQVLRLQAADADIGINGEVRYQLLHGRNNNNDAGHRFAIDVMTGQVRSIMSFTKDAGKVFGFDVKATDCRGENNGRSAIANVLIYVLDGEKQLIVVMDSSPAIIEKNIATITMIMYNITGFDIRVRKLEPHYENSIRNIDITDMYIYGIDPVLNIIADTTELKKVLYKRKLDIEHELKSHHILDIVSNSDVSWTGGGQWEANLSENRDTEHSFLSTVELGIVALGAAVFFSAIVVAVAVICVRRGRSIFSNQKSSILRKKQFSAPFYISSFGPTSVMSLFPTTYTEDNQSQTSEGDGYLEPFPKYPTTNNFRYRRGEIGVTTNIPKSSTEVKEERRCSRIHNPNGRLETSITSLHSSCKDSGICDGGTPANANQGASRCRCGISLSHSSEESSHSSYEDSLKSMSLQASHNLGVSHRRSTSLDRRPSEPITRKAQRHARLYRPIRHSFQNDYVVQEVMVPTATAKPSGFRRLNDQMAMSSAVDLRRHSDRFLV